MEHQRPLLYISLEAHDHGMVKLEYPDPHHAISTYLQVHADSSTFAHGASKREMYAQLLSSAKALFVDQRNWVVDPA